MKRIAAVLLALLLALTLAPRADAQTIAAGRSINLYVGFAAGGPADLLARIVAERLQEQLGQDMSSLNLLSASTISANSPRSRMASST